jgi:hypothetical protein
MRKIWCPRKDLIQKNQYGSTGGVQELCCTDVSNFGTDKVERAAAPPTYAEGKQLQRAGGHVHGLSLEDWGYSNE